MFNARIARILPVIVTIALPVSAQQPQTRQIQWEPYPIPGQDTLRAQLGKLTVPENRSKPQGRAVQLALVKLPSTATNPGAPIIYLDGGPGGNGIGLLRSAPFLQLFLALRSAGDVIVLAQRGTTLTTPRLLCLGERAESDVFATRGTLVSHAMTRLEQCASRFRGEGVDLDSYNSEASADDIEDVRRALGAPKVSLLGFSYGTHLGLATLRRHPSSIQRAVLAGTEPLHMNAKLPSTYDAQVKSIAALVARDSIMRALVPDFEALLRSTLDQLAREPAVVTVRSGTATTDLTIGREGLLYLLRRDIGDTNDLPVFPALLYTIAQRQYDILGWFAEKRFAELGGVNVMGTAVDCASGSSRERDALIAREIPGSIFGAMTNLLSPRDCEVIKVRDLGDAYRRPSQSEVPVLFVSGTLDSNTPPAQAESIRGGFRQSAHIIVENAGHESTLPRYDVRMAIVRFLSGEAVADQRLQAGLRFLTPEQARQVLGLRR